MGTDNRYDLALLLGGTESQRKLVRINFPAPRGGVFAASLHSSLRLLSLKNAASGGEFTRSDSSIVYLRQSALSSQTLFGRLQLLRLPMIS